MFLKLAILLVALAASCRADGDAFDSAALRAINLARANDDFGLNLLNRLELDELAERGAKPENAKNLLISPFSVSTVLSMVLAGANAETHDEILKTLGFNTNLFKTDPDIFASYKNLLHQLKQTTFADKKNELQIANSIALQKNAKILQTFLDTITDNFESKVFAEDFQTQAHESTVDINKWVSEKTNGKIAKLFSKDLNENTIMVLLNAIYFKGTWKTRFEKEKTVAADFELGLQKSVSVPTMNVKGHFKVGHFEDGQLLELPYGAGDELSMLIFVPDSEVAKSHKTISSQFASTLAHGSFKLAERLTQLRNMSVLVHLPKFKVESEFHLKTPLNGLGINKAFSTVADFSKMNGGHDLYLSDVVHKTFVEVNEEGSEAAAVTGAVVETRAMPLHVDFNANRPFLFLIRDNTHQLTLFSGIVNKP